MNSPVLYCAWLDIRTLRSQESRMTTTREGWRGVPWTVNSSFQPGRIVSFHNNLSVFSGIDETGLDGRVSINIARERYLNTAGPRCTTT